MEKIGLNKLREMFQEFYEGKGHLKRPSFSLIPDEDKSLLIINSGMAPLKPYFAGLKTPPANRMVTCQKCIRTADIENVGLTARHGTFFEMLGSFSFGDYFKTESLQWGWEFVTEVLNLPQDKIWASVYEEDDEAYDIWKNIIKMPEERIVRMGKDDNFWEIGTGPCGPCSEMYYDRGEKYGCGSPDCKPGCECDRYIEFWNHVFTQYSKDDEGNYSDLAKKNIDTGMGLERLACIMQDVDSIFAVDTIEAIVNAVEKKSGVKYQNGEFVEGTNLPCDSDISIRIITDHVRSATFMIGDKIMPSNEGRGYVLRRLIRRAVRHAHKLGIQDTFLGELSEKVIDTSAGAYPELEDSREFISRIIRIEENKFNETLAQGLNIIEDYITEMKTAGQTELSGEKAFKLHDTYGFPVAITEEILAEKGYTLDNEGFDQHMAKQKELGQKIASQADEGWKEASLDFAFEGKSEFTGYEKTDDVGIVKGIFYNQKPLDLIKEGEVGRVILDKTPFYPEGGGQSFDTGIIYSDDTEAEVIEVIKFQDVIAHKVKVITGEINPGETFNCAVDVKNRNATARNHTATHLLHKALKEVLGDHVQQAGSSVSGNGLRFDFNHFEQISSEDLTKIEDIVNDKIDSFYDVTTRELSMKDAVKEGAVGLFSEKYGDVVRVVTIGNYSKELCGGIHVKNTGNIGSFKIVSESGIASGVRRIEALTGRSVLERLNEKEGIVKRSAEALKTTVDLFEDRLSSQIEEFKIVKKELEDLKKEALSASSGKLIDEAVEMGGVNVITKEFADISIDELRQISDNLKSENKNLALIFASVIGEKVTFLVSLTDDVVAKGFHAGKIIKEVAAKAGGGGGGKADMAQAGGKDVTKVNEALSVAQTIFM